MLDEVQIPTPVSPPYPEPSCKPEAGSRRSPQRRSRRGGANRGTAGQRASHQRGPLRRRWAPPSRVRLGGAHSYIVVAVCDPSGVAPVIRDRQRPPAGARTRHRGQTRRPVGRRPPPARQVPLVQVVRATGNDLVRQFGAASWRGCSGLQSPSASAEYMVRPGMFEPIVRRGQGVRQSSEEPSWSSPCGRPSRATPCSCAGSTAG